jgi:hypothetical protein
MWLSCHVRPAAGAVLCLAVCFTGYDAGCAALRVAHTPLGSVMQSVCCHCAWESGGLGCVRALAAVCRHLYFMRMRCELLQLSAFLHF